ncbi:MAG: NfeD family protein [Fusobacteriaceae bacterium]
MESYILWIILLVFFFGLEMGTMSLVSFWFGLGAIVALIYSMFDENILRQSAVFLIVSAILLFSLRKIIKKLLKKNSGKNFDRIIGKETEVSGIDEKKNLIVYFDGKNWTGKSEEHLNVGDKVTIIGIEGVKLILKKIKN